MDAQRKSKKRVVHWDELPDLVVERIFCYLPKRSRYNAAMTCKTWLRVLDFPELWKTFVLRERTLTRSKFNYYIGYQDVLDSFVTQRCIRRIGRHFRRVRILPIYSFSNVYDFMGILNSFLTYFDNYQMPFLRAFEFYFSCELRTKEGIRVFGTGGSILEMLMKLMGSFRHLQELKLENLLLEGFDREHLLDNIFNACSDSIIRLSIVNCTKFHHFFMHCGLFLNLRHLTVSANHLHPDLIYLLSNLQYLQEFHILQTKFTTNGRLLETDDWRPLKYGRRYVRIFLEAAGLLKEEIIWQQQASVHAIVYHTPYSRLTLLSTLEIVKNYSDSLFAYCQFGLPRISYKRNRPMNERCDSLLLLLVRICLHLSHIVIHELISMATLLLIAHQTRGRLKTFYVRKNALLKKHAWRNGEDQVKLTLEVQDLLKKVSNYESFVEEMNILLQNPSVRWRPLTDKEFKELSLDSLNNA